MKKSILARPVTGLAGFLQAHFQASLKMALQKLRSIRCANDQHWPALFSCIERQIRFVCD